MGKYIAHTRRKIKPKKAQAASIDAAAIEARQHEIAAQREVKRLELERARAEKQARALVRAASKRDSLVDLDTSGRKRTAVRAAGLVLISATAGLRTHSISIYRVPGSTASDLPSRVERMKTTCIPPIGWRNRTCIRRTTRYVSPMTKAAI